MYIDDYIMREIGNFIRFVRKLLLDQEERVFNLEFLEGDSIHKDLLKKLRDGRINEGENQLFNYLEKGGENSLELVLDFYELVNQYSDEELEDYNFSRTEIREGLEDALDILKIDSSIYKNFMKKIT